MSESCIDSFKLGCDTCGNAPCCCGNAKKFVRDTRGDCTPLLHDPHHIFSAHHCDARGGSKTVGAPQYQLTIENPPDNIQRNPDGSPVLDSEGNVVAVNTEPSHCS